MAEVTFIAPVTKIGGKLNQKDKTVFRKIPPLSPKMLRETIHLDGCTKCFVHHRCSKQ